MIQECPRCHERQFATAQVSGIQLDRCSRCRGIWFDAGEFEEVIELLHGRENEEAAGQADPARPIDAPAYLPLLVHCPSCRKALLREAPMSFEFIHHFVMTDRCPECGGVWLDGSELELISKYIHDEDRAIHQAAERELRALRDEAKRSHSPGTPDKAIARRKFWRALVGLDPG